MKKIIAFAGSNSSQSINRSLVSYVSEQFDHYSVEILDLNHYEMPTFSVDREKQDGYPPQAHLFLTKIKEADALLVSLAEHNRSYTAAFKNIFDWISRIEKTPFFEKPMLLMSASPGGYGGGNVMETAKKFFPQFGANIIATFSLPKFQENFEQGVGITNETYNRELKGKIESFKEQIS